MPVCDGGEVAEKEETNRGDEGVPLRRAGASSRVAFGDGEICALHPGLVSANGRRGIGTWAKNGGGVWR